MTWILLPLFLMLQATAASIPVLALNEKGEFIEGQIEEKDYVQTLKAMKEAVDQKVMALDPDDSGKKWQLSKFSVGLGLTGEIGVGPYKYSSTIKQRFFYSR